ncbi:hypothetical protein AGMMS50268_18610 [Spirochaetia bacterium]|nr:hypothetical protein AGMMS50268_18610 [Spirochaetia bacterium]
MLELPEDRFFRIDFKQAKADALPFVRDTASLELWSRDFFTAISRERLK